MVAKFIFPWAVIAKYVTEDNMDPMWVKAMVAGSWVLVFPLWLGLFVVEGVTSLLCVFGPFDDTVTRVETHTEGAAGAAGAGAGGDGDDEGRGRGLCGSVALAYSRWLVGGRYVIVTPRSVGGKLLIGAQAKKPRATGSAGSAGTVGSGAVGADKRTGGK